jgi:phosphopantothenate-cysteine ligase
MNKGINVIITSGGTSEYIDKVRKITNSGSGALGALITERILELEHIDTIFYIYSSKAKLPNIKNLDMNKKIKLIEIVNTNDLKNAVEKTLNENKIDWFIHSMAVSDYYVDVVTTAEKLTLDISNNIDNISESIKNPIHKIDNTKKISSNEDNLIVILKQTPKIIGMIKKISPNTKLIGFKLLENVSENELIDVGINLMIKNDCDYVVANDLKNINRNQHKAFIIDKNKGLELMNTKMEIAQKIKEIVEK